jgi:hypothetical protein
VSLNQPKGRTKTLPGKQETLFSGSLLFENVWRSDAACRDFGRTKKD